MAYIKGWVKIGTNNEFHPFSVIGDTPQDYSYNGEKGLIEIGNNCLIREGVTINTPVNGMKGTRTIIKDSAFLMANSHVGHNSIIGERSLMANGCVLAGFVEIENDVFLSGNVAVHQYCRIGSYSMVGGLSKVVQDIPPYFLADGNPASGHGLNNIGLKRKGIGQEQRTKIKEAYKLLYSGKIRKEALKDIRSKFFSDPLIMHIVNFVESSVRGVIRFHEE
jgi:UDP-N-acetylglucosamine acyltransferase